MAEGTKDAMLLISTSYQALGRAIQGNQQTLLCDCTVVTLFASFFIEANLNYIVLKLGKKKDMNAFLGGRYPGLQDKLAWFYNEYVATSKSINRNVLFRKGIKKKLRRRYPGFATLYRFRNDISHGRINKTARSLPEVVKLRHQAKDIVDDLFNIAERVHGHTLPRAVDYQQAIR